MADNIAEVFIKLETDLADAKEQLQDTSDAVKKVGDAVEETSRQYSLLDDALNIDINTPKEQLGLFTEGLESIKVAAGDAVSANVKLSHATMDMTDVLKHAGAIFEQVKSAVGGLQKAFNTAFEAVNEMTGGLLEASKGFLELLGIGFAVHEIKEFIESCVELYAEEERVAIGLAHMRGSAEAAGEQFEQLHAQADKLGIAFEPMLSAATRLAAFGLTTEQTAEFMQMAADSSTAMGTSFQSASGSLSRIVETGVMSGRVLRNLGLETKDVAAAMGVANSQVAAVGRELDEETRLAVIKTAQEMKGLSGAAAEAADSTSASMSRFGNAMNELKVVTGEALSGVATEFINMGTDILKEITADIELINKLGDAWDKLGQKLGLSFDVAPIPKKTKEEIEKEAAANKKKIEESGALYKQEAGEIDIVKQAEQSRMNIEKINDAARRKMGLETSQELLKHKRDQLEAEYHLEMDALNEKEKLPKGSKTDEIEKQLRLERLKTIHHFDEERAKLEVEGAENTDKIQKSVSDNEIRQAAATANHQIEMERDRISKLKALKFINAAEVAAAEHKINQGQLDADNNAIAARAGLMRRKGMEDAEIASTSARERQAAQEKFAKAEQDTEDALLADKIRRERAAAEADLNHSKKTNQRLLSDAREAATEQYKAGDISFEELSRQRMLFQQKELSNNLDYIYNKQMLDIAGGKNAEEAQKDTDEAVEDEYADHNQKMIKITRELSAEMLKEDAVRQRARMTTLQTEVELTVAAAESRKRLAGEEAGANQITAAERIDIERNADAEINTARLHSLAIQLANAASMKGSDADRAAAVAKVTGEIQKLNAAAARTDMERSARAAIESARLLGQTYGQVRTHVEDLIAAYELLKNKVDATANDMANAWKKVLEGYQQMAESAGHAIVVVDQAGKEHVMTLSQIAIAIEVINRQQENQKNQALLLANVYRDLTSTYDAMFGKFAGGFAQVITTGKKFGDTMMNILHQVEQEILSKLIGTALTKLAGAFANMLAGGGAGGLLQKLGTLLGGVAKGGGGSVLGAAPGADSIARASQGAEQAAAEGTLTTALATADATQVTLTTAIGATNISMGLLNTAIDMNTMALYATGFIPGLQEGGQVMRTGVALVHAGETVASKNIMQGVGETLTAGATPSGHQIVSFDGATFHGVPDQRYVSGIMNNAVRQLRQSSRTWAFNPTGQ